LAIQAILLQQDASLFQSMCRTNIGSGSSKGSSTRGFQSTEFQDTGSIGFAVVITSGLTRCRLEDSSARPVETEDRPRDTEALNHDTVAKINTVRIIGASLVKVDDKMASITCQASSNNLQ
jgi:hypothetical protein